MRSDAALIGPLTSPGSVELGTASVRPLSAARCVAAGSVLVGRFAALSCCTRATSLAARLLRRASLRQCARKASMGSSPAAKSSWRKRLALKNARRSYSECACACSLMLSAGQQWLQDLARCRADDELARLTAPFSMRKDPEQAGTCRRSVPTMRPSDPAFAARPASPGAEEQRRAQDVGHAPGLLPPDPRAVH